MKFADAVEYAGIHPMEMLRLVNTGKLTVRNKAEPYCKWEFDQQEIRKYMIASLFADGSVFRD